MFLDQLSKVAVAAETPAKVGDSKTGAPGAANPTAKKIADSKAALKASVVELLKDHSVVDILKAFVSTSPASKLIADAVAEALSKIPDSITDYDDQITFEDGAFITEEGSYPTVEQARLALAMKAEVKEPVQLSESLSYNPETSIFTKTVVNEEEGSSETMEYQTIEAALGLEVPEPLTDAVKAEKAQKIVDAITKMKTRILDTESTEEVIEAAKEALTDVPAEDVLKGVIEVLAEVIETVKEPEQPTV